MPDAELIRDIREAASVVQAGARGNATVYQLATQVARRRHDLRERVGGRWLDWLNAIREAAGVEGPTAGDAYKAGMMPPALSSARRKAVVDEFMGRKEKGAPLSMNADPALAALSREVDEFLYEREHPGEARRQHVVNVALGISQDRVGDGALGIVAESRSNMTEQRRRQVVGEFCHNVGLAMTVPPSEAHLRPPRRPPLPVPRLPAFAERHPGQLAEPTVPPLLNAAEEEAGPGGELDALLPAVARAASQAKGRRRVELMVLLRDAADAATVERNGGKAALVKKLREAVGASEPVAPEASDAKGIIIT
jgi:hypothetical protein